MNVSTSEECNDIYAKWNSPAGETLGGTVTTYLAQIKEKDSGETWRNCTWHEDPFQFKSCVFTKLKKETHYVVRVMAKNKVGFGLPTEKFIKTGKAGNYWTAQLFHNKAFRANQETIRRS